MFTIASPKVNSFISAQRTTTAYEEFQLKRYGNIIPVDKQVSVEQDAENGLEDLTRFAEWMEAQADNKLLDKEK